MTNLRIVVDGEVESIALAGYSATEAEERAETILDTHGYDADSVKWEIERDLADRIEALESE